MKSTTWAGAPSGMVAAILALGGIGPPVPAAAQPTSTPVAAPGDAQRGAARTEELYCGACHGPRGTSETPEWPSLAGQVAAYLASQLALLRSGERINLEMGPIAATLTDADIADLSAYYSTLSPPQSSPPSMDGGPIAALYRSGDASRSIRACADCHGVTGGGDGRTLTPALRAQQPVYVRTQLEAYSRRSRYKSATPPGTDPAALQAMYDAAARLTADEMQQIALYLRGLN